jgi:hypothetical protein
MLQCPGNKYGREIATFEAAANLRTLDVQGLGARLKVTAAILMSHPGGGTAGSPA